MVKNKTVLITGTSSGVGLALLAHYSTLQCKVVCINRGKHPELEARYRNAIFKVLDISSYDEVFSLLNELNSSEIFPQIYFLNAGINRLDNFTDRFDFRVFQEVMQVNLNGSLTFVSAAREIYKSGLTFVGISSTSNVVPNPGHLGYSLSKLGILRTFELLQKNDPFNTYKVVELGPMHTQIARNFKGPQGIQKTIINFISGDVEKFAPVLDSFAKSSKKVLYYPRGVHFFYLVMKFLLSALPFLYRGTKSQA